MHDLGVPLDGAALLRSAVKLQTTVSSPVRSSFIPTKAKIDPDVDGMPSTEFINLDYRFLIDYLYFVVSDDLDGVPMKASPPRKKESKSKWETEGSSATEMASSPPASKWDTLDASEADEQPSNRKRSKKSKAEEDIFADLDGVPMAGSSPDETITTPSRHSSDSKYVTLLF